MRLVLDANVVVSGVAGSRHPNSTPGAIYRAWRNGAFDLVLSEHIVEEVGRALADRSFRQRLSPQQISGARIVLRRRSIIVPITVEVHGVATHPEDDLVLATAVSARVDYLVTGDIQLQKLKTYEGVTILSPRAFLDVLEGGGDK